MKPTLVASGFIVTAALSTAGCTGSPDHFALEDAAGDTFMSFEDFASIVYQEPETGVYIVNGDELLENREQLEAFYTQHVLNGALIVNKVGGVVDRWGDEQKRYLTYCVSTDFGSNHSAVVQGMAQATSVWQSVADVMFVYRSEHDGSCSSSNGDVVFDVRPTSGQPYLARAFFPSTSRVNREILIDASSFGSIGVYTLAGILRHELGHSLGFRHEHTRPEAGVCFEDINWQTLTPYDSASVMHYPQCNGTNKGDLVLTQHDKEGSGALYGPPLSYLSPVDWGYSDRRWMADFDGDGKVDYCRAVGTSSGAGSYLRCTDTDAVESMVPIDDWGYSDRRWMADFDGDGKVDYCRAVGTSLGAGSYLRCTDTDAVESMVPIDDWGYSDRRWMADFDGDGKVDYCRAVGTSSGAGSYLRCTDTDAVESMVPIADWGYSDRRWMDDFDGDGKVDYCRAVGTSLGAGSYLRCTDTDAVELMVPIADWGYSDRRWMDDFDGDGKVDYCRAVGTSSGAGNYFGCSH